ncbi:helix-turn-helix transcriptional regulator [Dietzia aurantiaca]|mgnify:CR=1 FL=1|uniref:winged helix-turn-helix transcriptional regulator n=1 Tax=Dietzia aurantiaca TaxID=983873 RepID=UPI001E2DBE78|nr:helix-turn-helix domain-containing protein [Dietzia aurantiaca]MCD2263752.1 helix-turn-helix transcriptional regulator [Dietzia aurantiaca]
MDWLSYDSAVCSIRRTLDVVGERWSLLILREAFNGVRRFDQMRDHLGVSDAVLSARLRRLVEAGVLEAVPYQEPGSRTRNEYRLTSRGHDLYPVMIALLNWGDEHRAGSDGPPLEVVHDGCGEPARVEVRCAAGHVLDSARESRVSPGPGARLR